MLNRYICRPQTRTMSSSRHHLLHLNCTLLVLLPIQAIKKHSTCLPFQNPEIPNPRLRFPLRPVPSCYKRVKGRSHTVEKRISMHPHKPHATSQPSRFSHTRRLSRLTAQLAQPLTAPHTHVPSCHQHCPRSMPSRWWWQCRRSSQPSGAVSVPFAGLHVQTESVCFSTAYSFVRPCCSLQVHQPPQSAAGMHSCFSRMHSMHSCVHAHCIARAARSMPQRRPTLSEPAFPDDLHCHDHCSRGIDVVYASDPAQPSRTRCYDA